MARPRRARSWLSPSSLLITPKVRPTTWIAPYSASDPGSNGERIEIGHGFSWLTTDESGIWATNGAGKTVTRIDARTLQVTNKIDLRRTPAAIAAGTDAVWVVCANGWLWRLHPDGSGEGVARLGNHVRGLACDSESTWVLHANGDLVQVNQATGETVIEPRIGRGGRQLLYVNGAFVALCWNGRKAHRVSPTLEHAEAKVKLPAQGVRGAILHDTFWVACGRRFSPEFGTLVPIDINTLAVKPPLRLPAAPRAIAAGAGYLWVACGIRGQKACSLKRVDPSTGEIKHWADSDWNIYDLAVDGERLLTTVGLALVGPSAGMGGEGAIGGAPAHHSGGHFGGGEGHGGGHGGGH